MGAEIKEEGKKNGKVELFFSLMDKAFKTILLILGVVFIIMFYSNSHGRYQIVHDETGGDVSYAILDTRDGIMHVFGRDLSASVNVTDGNVISRRLPPADTRLPAPAPGAPSRKSGQTK